MKISLATKVLSVIILGLAVFMIGLIIHHNTKDQPVEETKITLPETLTPLLPEPENTKPEQIAENEITEEFEETLQIQFPCNGMIEPQSPMYINLQGREVLVGKLKLQRFSCQVLQEIREYYIISITEPGFQRSIYLVKKEHVTVLTTAGDLAILPSNNKMN